MAKHKVIELDGRTGEGGGQLVRVAVSLSALTGIPIRIVHVRGNRKGHGRSVNKEGGGLKAQHISSISYLAEATKAIVTGATIGSKTLEFAPTLPPTALPSREIRIRADSAASILLVFQALFPFLLFASHLPGPSSTSDSGEIILKIQGGTNISWSLSYEYLDQVLLPTLTTRLGIPSIKRRLIDRGWSHGTASVGAIALSFKALDPGQSLCLSPDRPSNPVESWIDNKVTKDIGKVIGIDISLVVPTYLRDPMINTLAFELDLVFPSIPTAIVVDDDSQHAARVYLLLVARTANGHIFGRDWLYDKTTRNKPNDKLATEVVQKVVDDLDKEVRKGGMVDEFLGDQLVVFRALAKGKTYVTSEGNGSNDERSEKEVEDDMRDIGGKGSTHAKTARWVVSQMLPEVKWFNGGDICEGVGWSSIDSSANKLSEGVNGLSISKPGS